MSVGDPYQRWLNERRRAQPGPDFTDRVMAAVAAQDEVAHRSRLLMLSMWVDRSRPRRFAACAAALLVGAWPLVYLAYLSQVFVF